jgi:hypothetical protein
MSPTEFADRLTAADERFAQARKRDDIREMRAALAEKTWLLEMYFAAPRPRAHDEREGARSAAPVARGALPSSAATGRSPPGAAHSGRLADAR